METEAENASSCRQKLRSRYIPLHWLLLALLMVEVAVVVAALMVPLLFPSWRFAKYRSVKLGMTRNEVERILGSPGVGFVGAPLIGNQLRSWTGLSCWQTDEGIIAVAFDLEKRACSKLLYISSDLSRPLGDPELDRFLRAYGSGYIIERLLPARPAE